MNCPVCNRPMNPVTTKTNPKAPDWKCSDLNCKFQYNKISKVYEPSQYVTAAWNPKVPTPSASVPQAAMTPSTDLAGLRKEVALHAIGKIPLGQVDAWVDYIRVGLAPKAEPELPQEYSDEDNPLMRM